MIWCLPASHSRYRLRVIKLLVLLLPVATILSACVTLSPAGAQVRILEEDQAATLSACQFLGQVSVSSEDALRNAAASLSGDTAVRVVKETAGSFYIRGSVYRCGTETAAPRPVAPHADQAETARKTAKCHDKGGTWNGYQCIIEIE